MIEWLVQKLFWWDALRKAIFDEVHLYDHIDTLMENGTDIASSSWMEGDTWYGWTYNEDKKRYYFDDIGNKSLVGLWEDQWLREAENDTIV